MGLLDRFVSTGAGTEAARLREELRTERWQSDFLESNLRTLETTMMEDPAWRRIGYELEHEFSRDGMDRMVDVSRAMYLANPLIQRAVNVTTYYTWAQGVEYVAEDDRIQAEVVEPQLENEGNRIELYSIQARVLTDVDQLVDGNVVLALFTDQNGDVNVRSIPIHEIREIIADPQDRNQVRYYRRVWSQNEFDERTGRTATRTYDSLYPDIRYQPLSKPSKIGDSDVYWDAPIIHQRTGGLKHMQFGIPQTYAAMDWARAYRKFLEDWHTIVASLATFAWTATTRGSKVDQLKRKLGVRTTADELEETPTGSRPPVPGSVFVGGADDKLAPVNRSGATMSAEDAKPSRMMVASAMDLPDTILSSDPQQGALATAKTLDRPTELGMLYRQKLWSDLDGRIFRYIVDAKVRRGKLPGRIVRDGSGTKVEPGIDPSVSLQFPPILEHDKTEEVHAIVSAATLEGKTDAGTIPREVVSRELMNALGIEDIEAAIDELDQEQQDSLAQAVNSIKQALGPGQQPPQPGQQPQPAGGPSANGNA